MKTSLAVRALLLALLLLGLLTAGCTALSNPVSFVQLFKVQDGGPAIPPPGPWAEGVPTQAFPTLVQIAVGRQDKMFAGIVVNRRLTHKITFSRYTFFNEATHVEEQLGAISDLGPFVPGQVLLVGMPYGWNVPTTPGMFQFRIYVDDKIVATARFEVTPTR